MRPLAVLALGSILVAAPALASPAPLSSLGALAQPGAAKIGDVAGVKVTPTTYGGLRTFQTLDAKTSRGFCLLASSSFDLHTSSSFGGKTTPEDPVFLLRLGEKDKKTILEKSRLSFDDESGEVGASKATSIELQEVAKNDGVSAFAFREGKSVVLLARGVTGGIETPPSRGSDMEGFATFVGADQCPFALARLDTSVNGSIAQLSGEIAQGKGKERKVRKFLVDASLSKVTRDPEPVLSVHVRFKD